MNLDEFGKWSPYNDDNPKYSSDEYNRSFLKERFECPDEYEGSDYDEYYSVPKMSDSFEFKKDKEDRLDKKNGKDKNKRQLRQNLIRQVVCLAAGSVIITTSYQSMAARQQQVPVPDVPFVEQTVEPNTDTPPVEQPQETAEPVPEVLSPHWIWSDDRQTVILELLDSVGNVVKSIHANVSISEEAAVCTAAGLRTYTATVIDGSDLYTDTQEEVLPPLGHIFDDGQALVLVNGQTAMSFTCTRCHEDFTITTSMTEND